MRTRPVLLVSGILLIVVAALGILWPLHFQDALIRTGDGLFVLAILGIAFALGTLPTALPRRRSAVRLLLVLWAAASALVLVIRLAVDTTENGAFAIIGTALALVAAACGVWATALIATDRDLPRGLRVVPLIVTITAVVCTLVAQVMLMLPGTAWYAVIFFLFDVVPYCTLLAGIITIAAAMRVPAPAERPALSPR